MEVESAIYNEINGFQMADGLKLINKIKNDQAGRTLKRIVDIGCGSGNVTSKLAAAFNPQTVLGLDIDKKMIDFAINNCPIQGTEYIVEDISKPWESLDPKLKALEGTVDLVFSNYVLHWINDRATASQNMSRLLNSNGHAYLFIGSVKPICDFLPSEIRSEIEEFVKVDSLQDQVTNWSSSLEKAGLGNVETELLSKIWKFDIASEFRAMLTLFRNCYLHLISKDKLDSVDDKMMAKIQNLVYRTLTVPSGVKPDDVFKDANCTLFYDSFWVKAEKWN